MLAVKFKSETLEDDLKKTDEIFCENFVVVKTFSVRIRKLKYMPYFKLS